MSTLTATRVATLPRVNLLPPEIEHARRFRRVQAALGAGVVASLGIVGALVVMANGAVSSAEDDLATEQAQQTRLQSQMNEFAEVPVVYARVEAAEAQLAQAMGKEVRWSYYLNDLSLKIPSKVWLTNMTVTQTVDEVAATTAPVGGGQATSYVQPGLGNVTFEGMAYRHNDVASWLVSLAKQKGYEHPYFTDSTKQAIGVEDVVAFKSQVTITERALSQRYTQKAGS